MGYKDQAIRIVDIGDYLQGLRSNTDSDDIIGNTIIEFCETHIGLIADRLNDNIKKEIEA